MLLRRPVLPSAAVVRAALPPPCRCGHRPGLRPAAPSRPLSSWHDSAAQNRQKGGAGLSLRVQRGRAVRAVTRRLLLRCHPDYFQQQPKKYRKNTRSLQELQGLLDAAFPEDGEEALVASSALRVKLQFHLDGQRSNARPVSTVFDVPAACHPEALAGMIQGGILHLAGQAGVKPLAKELPLLQPAAAEGLGTKITGKPRAAADDTGWGSTTNRDEREDMIRQHEWENTEVAERDEMEEVVGSLFFAPGLDAVAQHAALKHLAVHLPLLRRQELWRDLPLVVGVPTFGHGEWLEEGFLAVPASFTAPDFVGYVSTAGPAIRAARKADASRARRDYGD